MKVDWGTPDEGDLCRDLDPHRAPGADLSPWPASLSILFERFYPYFLSTGNAATRRAEVSAMKDCRVLHLGLR